MTTETESAPVSRAMLWTGWVLTVLPSLLLLFSGVMKLVMQPATEKDFAGIPPSLAVPIGILEIACTIIYLIPRTAVLGAILLAGYMGGAILTHLRLGDSVYIQALIGVIIWLGIYLREPRLRKLIPLRR